MQAPVLAVDPSDVTILTEPVGEQVVQVREAQVAHTKDGRTSHRLGGLVLHVVDEVLLVSAGEAVPLHQPGLSDVGGDLLADCYVLEKDGRLVMHLSS